MNSPIEDLLQSEESQHLEKKSSSMSLKSIGAAVCAFLNSEGGNVLIGVKDREIVPVPDVEKKAAQIEAYLRSHIVPTALWAVAVESTSAGKIISVSVPPGPERPYLYDDRIYLRRHTEHQLATPREIRDLVQQRASQPTRWERLSAPGLEIDDLNEKEVLRTAASMKRLGAQPYVDTRSVTSILEGLSLRQFGALTNGADVLFGLNPTPRLPQTRVRVSRFASDKGGDFLDDGVVEGNAFNILDGVFHFLRGHIRVSSEFEPGELARQDTPEYPFNALREGVINAIIHRDYSSFRGGMSVGIYPTRLEIWNSGQLPDGLKIQDLKHQHPSLPTNPDMAHVFYLRGYIERLGRGTQKIIQDCKEANLPVPTWKAANSGILLTFFNNSAGTKERPLNGRQRELLKRLQPGEVLPPSSYYADMDGIVSQRQAQRDLTSLEDGGWLRREGDGPSTVYIRTKKSEN